MAHSTMRAVVLAAVAGSALIGASLPALAEEAKREATITVSGNGESRATPDMAVITLSVTKQEKSASESLDANSKAMSAVLEKLKADGLADKDMQTSGFSIQPVYSYPQSMDSSSPAPQLVGYQTVNSLTIRLHDLAKAGAVIDSSVSMGINQGGDIRFTNEDTKPLLSEARKQAVKDAVEKAKEIADAAGVSLGRIIDINESLSSPVPVPMAMMAKDTAISAPVPMAPGENTYSCLLYTSDAADD